MLQHNILIITFSTCLDVLKGTISVEQLSILGPSSQNSILFFFFFSTTYPAKKVIILEEFSTGGKAIKLS